MSLIFAEGFEHFHESITGLSSNVNGLHMPKYRAISHQAQAVSSFESIFSGQLSGLNMLESHEIVKGMVNEHIEAGRKGGRAILLDRMGASPLVGNRRPVLTLTTVFKKSRTVFAGFAFRRSVATAGLTLAVSFGRKQIRTGQLPYPLHNGNANWLGGCMLHDRGNYLDIEWHFVGQPVYYDQLFHNRNLANGDWHYIEVGTTVYGNQPSIEDCTAWGEVRSGGISTRREGIRTAAPGSNEESYVDTMAIIGILNAAGSSSRIAVAIDDMYVCNDEGPVNNGFLGGIFVRPGSPSHTAALQNSYSVGAVYRHQGVGPSFAGNPAALPDPQPTPEEDPNFEPWADPGLSHIVLPNEGNRQNFSFTDVPFIGSSPRIFGAVLDVFADIPNVASSRGMLIPIKTVGGASHSYFEPTSDMLGISPKMCQLIMENPKAQHPVIDEADIDWSANAVNWSDYGFRIDPAIEQKDFEADWNTSLLRYPVTHEQEVDEVLGLEEFASRHWEEHIYQSLDISPYSRWDWACPVYETLTIFDETSRIRASYLFTFSHLKGEDRIAIPEEFIRDDIEFVIGTQIDFVQFIDDSLSTIVSAYHEWVEELRTWLDPYDHADRAWAINANDSLGIEVTDIFDNHFAIKETIPFTDHARSNHEFLTETMYAFSHAQDGVILHAEDSFNLDHDHHDGNWVEQFEEWVGAESSILTRHWRFEIWMGSCVGWWAIGTVEQPLEYWEDDPCHVKRMRYGDLYNEFADEEYDEYVLMLKQQWLHFGGDPDIGYDNVRWAEFNEMVFDVYGTAVDMVDVNGISIIQGGT